MAESSQQATHIVGSKLEVDDQPSSNPTANATIDDEVTKKVASEAVTDSTHNPMQFRNDHGRRYHAFEERQYWLPNDDIEINRLDIQHHIWRLTMGGGLHISPISKDAKHVIDIGTGTGAWAIDFSEAHPSIEVLGTDLSSIQPKEIPTNCTFQVHNAESEWNFPQKYDFINARMLLMGIHDWPLFFKKAWDSLQPGGWLEVINPEFPGKHIDKSVTEKESAVLRWSSLIREAAGKDGIDTLLVSKYKPILEAQGFANIRAEPVQWPFSPWAKGDVEKIIGQWMIPNVKAFIRPSAQALLTKWLGWSDEQIDQLVKAAEAESSNTANHLYFQFYIWSAQKPENAT